MPTYNCHCEFWIFVLIIVPGTPFPMELDPIFLNAPYFSSKDLHRLSFEYDALQKFKVREVFTVYFDRFWKYCRIWLKSMLSYTVKPRFWNTFTADRNFYFMNHLDFGILIPRFWNIFSKLIFPYFLKKWPNFLKIIPSLFIFQKMVT